MITIDNQYPDRIDIGPDKKFDWVQVDCVSRIVSHNVIVNDYCDNSKIERIQFDVYRNRWLIFKKESVWGFYPGESIYDARLELIEKL